MYEELERFFLQIFFVSLILLDMNREGIKMTVRALRRNQTQAEKKLWELLRRKQLLGKKFYRQYPVIFKQEKIVRFFVADFYCREIKLVVEIDGKIHEDQKEYDEIRTYIMNVLGITVIRFSNKEVLEQSDKVLEKIKTCFL